MKFLIDESEEYSIVKHLRKEKHDVIAVCEESAGIHDEEVLHLALKGQRILITNDKDFGTLIYFRNMEHHGVILLRLFTLDVIEKIKRLDFLLATHADKLETHFIVVDQENIRIRNIKQ